MKNKIESVDFFSYESLIDRLTYQIKSGKRDLVFLLGAPISAPELGRPGVCDVDGMVEKIRSQFSGDVRSIEALDSELALAGENAYQASMKFLLGRRGQDSVNELIREAVVGARFDVSAAAKKLEDALDSDNAAKSLESDLQGWCCPKAITDLVDLIKSYPKTLGKVQLTTNFDPLLSIAMQIAGGAVTRSVLGRDGSLSQIQSTGCHIVHLHGYWYGSDTLHTMTQLNQDRPQLRSSLSMLLRNCTVVPVAYGGWDDIFTSTLADLIDDNDARHDVIWTFYGDHDPDLLNRNKSLILKFEKGIGSGRVQFYKGVDCRRLFSDLKVKLIDAESLAPEISIEDRVSMISEAVISKADVVSVSPILSKYRSEAIPYVGELIGRGEQIGILNDKENKLISIGGIGGQGKTSIAASFAIMARGSSEYDYVDWRDCRELDDTLHTVFVRMAMTLIDKNNISNYANVSLEDVIENLCSVFTNRSGVVVFDNVDQYVDLTSGEPLGPLRLLIDKLILAPLKTKFIFTSRPLLRIDSGNSFSISLKGLSEADAGRLFESKSSRSLDASELSQLCQVTEGHPLWISLIGARCKHENVSPQKILENIAAGRGDVPERMILSMWGALNEKQKTVLRALAEIERPLVEDDVADISYSLNYNQFTKAIRVLKTLGLVEIRNADGGRELLDLHPLVRQYIRKNFPQPERAKFISQVIFVLDRHLAAVVGIFKKDRPAEVLDIWIHKIDILLNAKDSNAAIDALFEIMDSLPGSGLGEELLRLAIRIFEQVDWYSLCATSRKFNKVWALTIKTMCEFGQFVRADEWISRYEASIEGAGGVFINLCDTRCYRYWIEGNFELAIYHGEKGVSLKSETNVDVDYDASHNLALAWRDGGYVNEALAYFLGTSDEALVLSKGNFDGDRPGSFYGNIGRCYFKLGRLSDALVCYQKSALALEKSSDGNLNRGYIRYWVGQALLSAGAYEDGAFFLRAAYDLWEAYAPSLAAEIESELISLFDDHPEIQRVYSYPSWRLENRFMQWAREI